MAGLLGTSLTTDEMWDTLKSIGRGVNLGSTSGLLGGPVDLATMLLNNPGMLHPGLLGTRGLGIENPVGGSKWIEQKLQPKGLLPKRQGNWQETAGELASAFVNPATAAAVAGPKLYAMESKIAQNAAAPTTLNKQTGAVIWQVPNKTDPKQLAAVEEKMKALGPPEIRAFWDGEKYIALEGSHRIQAAKNLGLEPIPIEMVPKSWLTNHDLYDLPPKTSTARALNYLADSKYQTWFGD